MRRKGEALEGRSHTGFIIIHRLAGCNYIPTIVVDCNANFLFLPESNRMMKQPPRGLLVWTMIYNSTPREISKATTL